MSIQTEQILAEAAEGLRTLRTLPYGPAATPEDGTVAGKACVKLCDGDQDKARALWKLIVADLACGYMPHAICVALVRAANTMNLVPDVTAPEPT